MKDCKIRLENVLIEEPDSTKCNGKGTTGKVLVIFEKEEILFKLFLGD